MIWLATPPLERKPASLDEFRKLYPGVSIQRLHRWVNSRWVIERAMVCIDPWRSKVAQVRQCVFENAMNTKRADQMAWVELFHRMIRERHEEAAREPKKDDRIQINRVGRR